MNNPQLREKLADCTQIPTLPRQAQRLLLAFNDPDLDIEDLVKIIGEHPTITARLISLANSAWASPSYPVTSLERACINLGLIVVRSVSIALALIAPFNSSLCPAFDIQRFWISSKLVADTSVLLARVQAKRTTGFIQNLHTCGLLHNLGLICLAHLMPQETHQALSRMRSSGDLTVAAALRGILQTDYCEVGGLCALHWGLPHDLVAVIQYHRSPDYQNEAWEMTALVGEATLLVSNLLHQQTELAELGYAKRLGLNQPQRQQVFMQLEPLHKATVELAKILF